EARPLAPLEKTTKHEEHGINHPPGNVAPHRRHDKFTRIECLLSHQKARPHGEGEHHDQSEQHLPEGFAGIEMTVDDRCTLHRRICVPSPPDAKTVGSLPSAGLCGRDAPPSGPRASTSATQASKSV